MKVYTKKDLNEFLQSLTYDDVSLIPTRVSRIKSRTETSTNCEFLNIRLNLPVISSQMDTVTGLEMTKELSRLGCLGILNRFDTSLDELLNDKKDNGLVKAVSLALT